MLTFLRILTKCFGLTLRLLALAIALHTLVRLIRRFYKFPMPATISPYSDNPVRRRFFPPEIMPVRHGIEPGMKVLEVSPGNGAYTLETAGWVGDDGRVVLIDVQPHMFVQLEDMFADVGADNVELRVAELGRLPFKDDSFDAIYMMSVFGAIEDPERALSECYRVLRPSGVLAFSELITDPDFPLAQTLIMQSTGAGFRLKSRSGSYLAYTLVFEKLTWD